MIVFFFLKLPCLEFSWIHLKPLTFTFFKFKVPNFKQFLWNNGTGNMSDRELSRSKGRPGQREELCLEIFQVFICVRCFEIIGKYSAAACTRPGAFLEQVISTSGHRAQKLPNQIYTGVLQQHRRLFSATIFDFYWIFKRHVLPC